MNRSYRNVWNARTGTWSAASELAAGRAVRGAGLLALAALALWAQPAAADCARTGDSYDCTAGAPQTGMVGSGPATPDGTRVEVRSGATIGTTDSPAISLGNGADIVVRAGGTVQANAAEGSLGQYGDAGANTIEFHSNGRLIIEQGARVLATGASGNAEAINPIGTGNYIENRGEVRATTNAAIWFQATTGRNTIVNEATGVIEANGGQGTVIGTSGTMAIDFTNKGELRGSLDFADGDDTLRWHTGGRISGAINGGGGNNLLTLSGTGTDTFQQTLRGFQTVEKNDGGTWTFANALTGTDISAVRVVGGTLILGSDASGYTGSMAVAAPGVLQSTAAFAPKAIANDGLVRFAQPVDGRYDGLVSGQGGLEKTGAGTLTLARDQAFTGTTTIAEGTLRLGEGGSAGMVLGPIVDHGMLAIDRADTVTFARPITGTGAVTQAGRGTTVYTADNGYTGGTTIAAGTLQLGEGGSSGSIVGAVRNDGTLAVRRSDTLRLDGGISGRGELAQIGSGTTVLAGRNDYAGATRVESGTLRAGAADAFSAASAHAVAAGATLDTGGFDQTVAGLRNAGTVNLLAAVPGSRLTVRGGAYIGDGGTLRLGTHLGDSGSASDRLVLDGAAASASGPTQVEITYLGGLGALTTGSGIEVVSARNGATTTAQSTRDAFALRGGHVDAGAYEYRLYAADADGQGENWYLRSHSTLPVKPVDPATPGTPVVPAPAIAVPMYRAEVPLFAALPAQLRQADLAMLGNLHRRIGDDLAPSQAQQGSGVRRAWGRVISADIDLRQQGTVQPASRGRVDGFQAGTDLFATETWRAGVYVGQLDGDVRVSGFARGLWGAAGSNDLRTQYLGGYATYTGPSGFYADAVLQAARHRYTVRPQFNAPASGRGDGLTASIEVGQSFALAGQWRIEPQLQLVHQRLSLDDALIAGARVQQKNSGGWLARIGLRIKGEMATGLGTLQPYGRLNVYRAGGGTDVTRFIGPAAFTDIATRRGGTSTELAGGFTLAVRPGLQVYGELGRLFASGGATRARSSLQGSAGLRWQW